LNNIKQFERLEAAIVKDKRRPVLVAASHERSDSGMTAAAVTAFASISRIQITEETIPMNLTWHSNKGWSGYLTGKNSTQGGDL